MTTSDQAYADCIERIYAAMEDGSKWPELYEHLRLATASESVHVLGYDHCHSTLSYSDGANLPVNGELAYIQQYRLIDPRQPLIMRALPLQWVHCHEALDDDFVARDPFYQEFLIPNGRRFMSACKLVGGGDSTVIFSTLRTESQGPLPADKVAFLDRLLPHMARAARIGLRNFVHSTQALVGQMLVDRLRQPVILMLPDGQVMHVNDSARQLLASTGLMDVSEGKLQLQGPCSAELLRRCDELESELKKRQSGIGSFCPRFELLKVASADAHGDQLYAFFALMPPGEVMGTFGLRPLVMLLFYHPASAPAVDPSLLYAVFGLSPAECRLAMLLGDGLALKEIARVLGVQHDTVRKQLQSIFRKTGTNRQPDLVRLLLRLPHPFSPTDASPAGWRSRNEQSARGSVSRDERARAD